MLAGALHQLHGGDGMNLYQLAVHLIHPIGGELRGSAQGLGHNVFSLAPLAANRGSDFLHPSLSGGKIHHQDPHCLERGLASRQRERLNHGGALHAGELASPGRGLLFGGGPLSPSLRLPPAMMSAMSLEVEAGL
jgi:hypothetical protein